MLQNLCDYRKSEISKFKTKIKAEKQYWTTMITREGGTSKIDTCSNF